ncbi:MAG: hypothetical protein AMXMBFR81_22600 [Chthonomonas sp.]|nr:hypothetical protein [Fimbriimonadaceae bacterium]
MRTHGQPIFKLRSLRSFACLVVAPLAISLLVAGCDLGPEDDGQATVTPIGAELTDYTPDIKVGKPVAPDPALAMDLLAQIENTPVPARSDPFSLLGVERQYEAQQSSLRLMSGMGFRGFTPEEEDAAEPIPVNEPQPYRRLSGILVGETVIGILEADDQSSSVLIRPGMEIPGTPWKVKSIDMDKAVLIRVGQPNVLPQQVTVRLESRPGGVTTPNVPGRPGTPGRPGDAGGRNGGAGRADDI